MKCKANNGRYARLNLPWQEDAALLAVRSMLDTGLMKRATKRLVEKAGQFFNMFVWNSARDQNVDHVVYCGTVMCIGGAMEDILGHSPGGNYDDLFSPDWHGSWFRIKPKHAVKAIDNFRDTGHPQWAKVMERA